MLEISIFNMAEGELVKNVGFLRGKFGRYFKAFKFVLLTDKIMDLNFEIFESLVADYNF